MTQDQDFFRAERCAHWTTNGAPPRSIEPKRTAILHYDRGFPTRLEKLPRLCAMIAEHGEPPCITRYRGHYTVSWPIYPGAPYLETSFPDPWPTERARTLVRVSLEPA